MRLPKANNIEPSFRKATLPQIIAVKERLDALIEPAGQGYCHYREGSDASIAEELSISKFAVERIRRELFGKLKDGHLPSTQSDLIRKVDYLTAKLTEIEARVSLIEDCIKE